MSPTKELLEEAEKLLKGDLTTVDVCLRGGTLDVARLRIIVENNGAKGLTKPPLTGREEKPKREQWSGF